MGLGARLKKSREEAGLSPAIAAESLGISIERLVSWELEKEEPTARELAEAARLYHVSADILLAVEELSLIHILTYHCLICQYMEIDFLREFLLFYLK